MKRAIRPHELAQAKRRHGETLEQRNEAIFRLRRQGYTYTAIGREFSLSRERVRQIVREVCWRKKICHKHFVPLQRRRFILRSGRETIEWVSTCCDAYRPPPDPYPYP